MRRPLRAILVAALAASCASAPTVPDEKAPPPAPAPATTDAPAPGPAPNPAPAAAARPGAKAWDCQTAVPPYGGYEYDVGYRPAAPGAADEAMALARRRLLERLCGRSGSCKSLEPLVKPWSQGEGGGQVCAMAVVASSDLASWKQRWLTAEGLEAQLAEISRELLPGGKKKQRVFIDKIVDGNVPGGDRAEWLRLRMERALHVTGVAVNDRPKGWGGLAIPRGFDAVVEGRVVPRREERVPVLEVLWVARVRRGLGEERVIAPPTVFAADVVPAVAEVAALPEDTADVSIRLDAASGGSLCRGQRTQLTVEAQKAMHVRVFNLYGADGGYLMFPNPERPSDRLEAGVPTPLGGAAGFEAQPLPGVDAEQFVVLASDRPDGFGPFGKLAGYCRLTAAQVRMLRSREGLPAGLRIATDGYRLRSGAGCPKVPPPDPGTMAAQLEQLPLCR